MAATLAFGGVNPVTGRAGRRASAWRAMSLSIMASCGMYDFSGEWLLRVGLPAKSGVSGGLLAVAPSQFGVAAFSPRLDAHGNSVRAIAIVEPLAERLRDASARAAREHRGTRRITRRAHARAAAWSG